MCALRRRTISSTARAAALGRAIESRGRNPNRLVYDPFAGAFLDLRRKALVAFMRLPGAARLLLSLQERRLPGVLGNLLCRTRYIDESLRAGLGAGARQVVIFGAGFDSRAYRLDVAQLVAVFEVDRPDVFGVKRSALESLLGEVPANVRFVEADLSQRGLHAAMTAAGFDGSAPTFFICEGVSQYLTAAAIDDVLAIVAGCAAGSRIALTYIDQTLICGNPERQVDRKLNAWMERVGERWRSGINHNQIGSFLAARGLKLIAQAGAAEYRTRYLEPTGRRLNLYDGEYVAVAEVVLRC